MVNDTRDLCEINALRLDMYVNRVLQHITECIVTSREDSDARHALIDFLGDLNNVWPHHIISTVHAADIMRLISSNEYVFFTVTEGARLAAAAVGTAAVTSIVDNLCMSTVISKETAKSLAVLNNRYEVIHKDLCPSSEYVYENQYLLYTYMLRSNIGSLEIFSGNEVLNGRKEKVK